MQAVRAQATRALTGLGSPVASTPAPSASSTASGATSTSTNTTARTSPDPHRVLVACTLADVRSAMVVHGWLQHDEAGRAGEDAALCAFLVAAVEACVGRLPALHPALAWFFFGGPPSTRGGASATTGAGARPEGVQEGGGLGGGLGEGSGEGVVGGGDDSHGPGVAKDIKGALDAPRAAAACPPYDPVTPLAALYTCLDKCDAALLASPPGPASASATAVAGSPGTLAAHTVDLLAVLVGGPGFQGLVTGPVGAGDRGPRAVGRARAAVQLWVALPDRVANLCRGGPAPASLTPACFYPTAAAALVSWVLATATATGVGAPAGACGAVGIGAGVAGIGAGAVGGGRAVAWAREAAERLCRRGHARTLAAAWFQAALGLAPVPLGAPGHPGALPLLLDLVPSDACEVVLVGLVRLCACGGPPTGPGALIPESRRAWATRRLSTCLGAPGALGKSVTELLCRRVMTGHPWPGVVQRALCDYLLGLGLGQGLGRGPEAPGPLSPDAFLAALPAHHYATLWASEDVAGGGDGPRPRSLTALVLACVQAAPKDLMNPSSSRLLFALMDGVQLRLGSQVSSVRRQGMLVAREFSKRVTPDTPLAFDGECLSDSDLEDAWPPAASPSLVHGDGPGPEVASAAVGASAGGDATSPPSRGPVGGAPTPRLAPFALPEESEESSADESDPLPSKPAGRRRRVPPGAGPGGGPLVPDSSSVPRSVRDAVAAATSTEDFRGVRAALPALPSLIRACGGQESRTGHTLLHSLPFVVRSLLALEDRFATPGFEQHRAGALVACAVTAPQPACALLFTHLFHREESDGVRHDILGVLVAASRELSGVGAAPGTSPTSAPALPPPVVSSAPALAPVVTPADARAASSAVVAPRPPPKTRRWGTPRRPVSAPTRNRFADVARDFFWPLLQGLERCGRAGTTSSSLPHTMSPTQLLEGGVGGPSPLSVHVDADSGVVFDPFRAGTNVLLLTDTLRALAVMLECAYLAPDVASMASRLLDVAWCLRFHSDIGLRRTVAFCLGVVVSVMSKVSWDAHDEAVAVVAMEEVCLWLREATPALLGGTTG